MCVYVPKLLTPSILANYVYLITLGSDSRKFEKSSIHGNYYQMAIIDVKSKYVWDLCQP